MHVCSDDEYPDRKSEHHRRLCVFLHARDRRWRGWRNSYVTWQHLQQVSDTMLSRDWSCMSRDKPYDLFVCRMWLSRLPLWWFLCTSTYNVLLTTLERYAAVIYPIWYKTNVRAGVYYNTVRHPVMLYPIMPERTRFGFVKNSVKLWQVVICFVIQHNCTSWQYLTLALMVITLSLTLKVIGNVLVQVNVSHYWCLFALLCVGRPVNLLLLAC